MCDGNHDVGSVLWSGYSGNSAWPIGPKAKYQWRAYQKLLRLMTGLGFSILPHPDGQGLKRVVRQLHD
ncbi:MAG: hypothetical protein RKO68_07025 [Candidatus Accumulibacter sp.]|nr:hypothetical protein [Accumulibacter sp.]